jgi:hypothetical protein
MSMSLRACGACVWRHSIIEAAIDKATQLGYVPLHSTTTQQHTHTHIACTIVLSKSV